MVPELYYRHRGLLLICLGKVWVHTFGALDELWPGDGDGGRHPQKAFSLHNWLAPDWVWGLAHLVAASAVVYGLYRPRGDLFVIRLACALSASVFLLLGMSFFVSAVENWGRVSLIGPGLCGAAVIAAMTVVLEPSINPASLQSRYGARRDRG